MMRINDGNSIPPYIIERYIRLVGGGLPKFKEKGNRVWNFRCVQCGDSKTDSNKCRGYIIYSEKDSTYFYKCHKCGFAKGFAQWLKYYNPSLSKEMILETLKESGNGRTDSKKSDIASMAIPIFNTKKEIINIVEDCDIPTMTCPVFDNKVVINEPQIENVNDEGDIFSDEIELLSGYKGNIFEGATAISELSENHGARKYVQNRKIPEMMFSKLFYVWRFCAWVNTWKPGKFKDYHLSIDEPRLIIPFYNKEGLVYAVQGRSFRNGKDVLRYMTVKKNDNDPKIYGLERLNYDKPAMVLEGPIDSMFIDNALGMAGADVSMIETHTSDYVMVYDNEPRSIHIVKKLRRDIDLGKSVVIWPNSITQKDVNQMILEGGYSQEEINNVVYSSVYKGMSAQMKLAEWSIIKNDTGNWKNKRSASY